MTFKYRRLDAHHWKLQFGGYPLRDALLRMARLSWDTAPALQPGLAPAVAGRLPDFERYIVHDESGLPRSLSLFRVEGRNCQTYVFRKGEVWWFNGQLFAERLEQGHVPPDREIRGDPEGFLADLAVYLGIDDLLDGVLDAPD